MITFESVTKRYADGTIAVDSLDLEIPDGKIMVLVGPSGCGKTTSLRMINRLVEPTSGRILLDGQNVLEANPSQLRRGIGYVIQQTGLFPHRTIEDNIATVPLLKGVGKRQARERARELMQLVGLDAGHDGAPLSVPAVGRPAAARRRRQGARGGSAGAADGRAVQRRRPDCQSRAAG